MLHPHRLLSTARLYLRRLTAGDAPCLFALDSDPEVMRYISKGQPTPLERIENDVLPRILDAYDRLPRQGFWAAHEREVGAFIGWFHLRPERSGAGEMELGYRLRRSFWGMGYATEGSRALLVLAFRLWRLERVVATTLVDNVASRRVMEKCGMRFEKRFYYDESLLPGWSLEEREAVRYTVARDDFPPGPM